MCFSSQIEYNRYTEQHIFYFKFYNSVIILWTDSIPMSFPLCFDNKGRGRRAEITDSDITWVKNKACQKPKDFGYSAVMVSCQLYTLYQFNSGTRGASAYGNGNWNNTAQNPCKRKNPRWIWRTACRRWGRRFWLLILTARRIWQRVLAWRIREYWMTPSGIWWWRRSPFSEPVSTRCSKVSR